MSPFETQKRSRWVQDMLAQSRNNFGHEDVPWRRRSLMALEAAGLEGKILTTTEIEDALVPYIGPAVSVQMRAAMAVTGCQTGILVETGTLRRPEGARRSLREYHIIGHLDENQQAVINA